jgi:peptide/nickel transport system permease protein
MKARGSLRTYVLVRLVLTIPMVMILLTVVFLLMRVAPGDPITAALGGRLPPAQLAAHRRAAGLDQPLVIQYVHYLRDVTTGNLGTAITDNQPVTHILAVNGGATLELTGAALLVAIVVGVPLGLLAGRLRDRGLDIGVRLTAIVVYAMPTFFLGLVLQLVFGIWLGWLPTSNEASPLVVASLPQHTNVTLIDALIAGNSSAVVDASEHLVLPACTLGLITAAVFSRLVRINVIQTLRSQYVDAARARGISEPRVVVRHAFRNALVPVITVMGLQSALLLSGAVLTENTFNWPGIGNALTSYLANRDYTAVQGIVTAFALVVVAVSLIIDLVAAVVDPRVRY